MTCRNLFYKLTFNFHFKQASTWTPELTFAFSSKSKYMILNAIKMFLMSYNVGCISLRVVNTSSPFPLSPVIFAQRGSSDCWGFCSIVAGFFVVFLTLKYEATIVVMICQCLAVKIKLLHLGLPNTIPLFCDWVGTATKPFADLNTWWKWKHCKNHIFHRIC